MANPDGDDRGETLEEMERADQEDWFPQDEGLWLPEGGDEGDDE